MQSSSVPSKFPIPFANSAGGLYTRTIPQASQIGIQDGAASLTDGFPPKCFVPVASGGTPPFGKDFNGLLKQVTQWNQWQQAGGPIVYDSSFQSAIGGYPMGAIIEIVAGGPAFMSTVENNTIAPAVGAAGWMPVPTFGANVTTVTATGALSINNAGLILVDATAGNVIITMPAVAGANGVPLPFNFTRTDSSGNTVTVTAAGSDKFWPTNGSSLSIAAEGSLYVTGDGASAWRQGLTGLNNTWTGANTFTQPVNVGAAITSNEAINLGQFISSLTGSGYLEIPTPVGNFIIQWGQVLCSTSGPVMATFPKTWPTGAFMMVTSPMSPTANGKAGAAVISTTQFNIGSSNIGGTVYYADSVGWIAIGR